MTRPMTQWFAWLVLLCLTVAGCGSTRSSPDNPLSAGGLTPSVQDPEAGLVAVAPGFDITKYSAIIVEKFPVTDPGVKDDGDRRFAERMNHYLHLELLRRMRESRLFQQVYDGSAAQGAEGPALRLRGAITRLGRGSQVARYFAGLYGAGRTRAQADMHIVDAGDNRVVLVTSDRRVASMGFFGGSDEEHLEESFNDMARDLGKFLVRLSKGQAPPGVR